MRYLRKKTKVFKMIKQITPIDPKLLKIRSKVELFEGVDQNKYTAIIGVNQKSRILTKDIARFEEMVTKMAHYCNHAFDAKKIIVDAPMCSKAAKSMRENGWEVVDATV
jgi:hypothetical protein